MFGFAEREITLRGARYPCGVRYTPAECDIPLRGAIYPCGVCRIHFVDAMSYLSVTR